MPLNGNKAVLVIIFSYDDNFKDEIFKGDFCPRSHIIRIRGLVIVIVLLNPKSKIQKNPGV